MNITNEDISISNELNKAMFNLIVECEKSKVTILSLDYSKNIGVIELENGTPRTIYFENNEWK